MEKSSTKKKFTLQQIKDNKLSAGTIKATAGAFMAKDASKKEKLEEVVDACADVTNDDRCEAAYEIWLCIAKECKDRDFKLF